MSIPPRSPVPTASNLGMMLWGRGSPPPYRPNRSAVNRFYTESPPSRAALHFEDGESRIMRASCLSLVVAFVAVSALEAGAQTLPWPNSPPSGSAGSTAAMAPPSVSPAPPMMGAAPPPMMGGAPPPGMGGGGPPGMGG